MRSLFEIHGTAYMVMDFEDGISLSKLLKEGRRFNERSLWNIIKPIAEGLDRAHRVGVLHRDIKPPNILITDDSRPVLIDFGSARFEAAEATSTTVTFHTPPYAAVEQYVKTYAQGPWTDIYALAVVLYECVTGEKPPEVLERMHAGLGTPLADGHWPGFSKKFLQAVDSGMTIKPSDRPQSIREVAMFGKKDAEAPVGNDDEPTQFFAHEVATGEIVPVAPPEFDKKDSLETGVPSDPREAQFKQAGQETQGTKKKKKAIAAEALAELDDEAEMPDADEAAKPATAETAAPEARKPRPKKPDQAKGEAEPWYRKQRAALLAGGGALAALVAVAGRFLLTGKGGEGDQAFDVIPALTGASSEPVALADVVGIAADERALAEEAQKAGAPATAVNDLIAAGEQIDKQLVELRPLLDDPNQVADANNRADEMRRTATTANVEFASALLRDAEPVPKEFLRPRCRARPPADQRCAGSPSSLSSGIGQCNRSRPVVGGRTRRSCQVPGLCRYSSAASAVQVATKRPTEAFSPILARPQATTTQASPTAVATAPAPTASAAPSASKMAQIRSVVASGRSKAKQVIAMGSSGSEERRANAKLAKNYDKYLANVSDFYEAPGPIESSTSS